MRKRIVRIWDIPSGGLLTALVVVSAAFAAGGILGTMLASGVSGGANDSLMTYIHNYLAAAQTGLVNSPNLFAVVWETIRWPLFTFLMGFTAMGVVGIPILFALRGFLFSFAVGSFVRMFGGAGGVLAFFSFGITGLVSIPVLFVLGVQGFAAAHALASRVLGDGKRPFPVGRGYFVRCGLCAAALALCALLEYFAVPTLLRSVATLF